MNSNFTKDLRLFEEYSLAIIDFFDKLPDSFFKDENMQPSTNIINNIVRYSKDHIAGIKNDNKLYRFLQN